MSIKECERCGRSLDFQFETSSGLHAMCAVERELQRAETDNHFLRKKIKKLKTKLKKAKGRSRRSRPTAHTSSSTRK